MKAGSTAMTNRPRDRVPRGSMLALPDPRRSDRANLPTNSWWSLFFFHHGHDLHALGFHCIDSQQGILCWGFKGVQEEIPSEEASTLQIGSVAFPPGQWTSPPYSPDLAPCDFWLFPKLRGCRYETIEKMKEAVTKVIDTLRQEDFHWAFQKLLEWYNECIAARGDYFEGN